MEEGLVVLKKAWTERPFSFKGKYYDLKDIHVAPEPLQKPYPTLWVAATAPAAAERAGRHGAGLHGASVDPEFHAAYFRGLEAGGYKKSDARISSPWSVTVTDEDPQKVWERNKQLYFDRWDFYRAIRDEMGDKEIKYGLEPVVGEAYRDNELIGAADVVLETLKGFAKKLPLTDIIHSGPAGGIPIREEAYPSLKRFAEKVLPELKKL
jgi:alkanesulfonate monooxygenase SsuD/methylene tetrahydromethanopterin reductase-like flavin-dependent oxidoreductase (luciferase family)